jgi:hypothetical protein
MKKGIIITAIFYLAVATLMYFVIKHLMYLNKVTEATKI